MAPRRTPSFPHRRIAWRDETGKFLVLRFDANGAMPCENDAKFRHVSIELATGKIVTDKPCKK